MDIEEAVSIRDFARASTLLEKMDYILEEELGTAVSNSEFLLAAEIEEWIRARYDTRCDLARKALSGASDDKAASTAQQPTPSTYSSPSPGASVSGDARQSASLLPTATTSSPQRLAKPREVRPPYDPNASCNFHPVPERASVRLQPAPADCPDYVKTVTDASRHFTEKNLQAAYFAVREAYSCNNGDPYVLKLFGSIEGERGEFAHALELLDKAVSLAPDDHEAVFNLAVLQSRLGSVSKAADLFRVLLESDTYADVGRHKLVHVLPHLGAIDEAEAIAWAAYRSNPSCGQNVRDLFSLLTRVGKADAVRGLLWEYLLGPGDGDVQAWQELCAMSHPTTQEMHRACEGLLERDEVNLTGLLIVGLSYLNSAMFEEAYAAFMQAYEHHPLDPQTNFFLGAVEKEVSRGHAGLEHFARAIELDPEYTQAYQNQGEVYLANQMLASAERSFMKAFSLNPSDGVIRQRLLSVLLLQGRITESGLGPPSPESDIGDPAAYKFISDIVRTGVSRVSALRDTDQARRTAPPELVIYCGNIGEAWGPSSEGLPGSEEALIHMSRKLTLLGYRVSVYNNLRKDDEGIDAHGVTWSPWSTFDPFVPVDVFVSWRGPENVLLGSFAGQRYLWMHDIYQPDRVYPPITDALTGIFVLCDNEAKKVQEELQSKVIVTANGLEPNLFVDGPNEGMRFIYASMPDRGLEVVLKQWHRIRASLPGATLDVYYGFTKVFDKMHSSNPYMVGEWKQMILELLEQDGIVYHGMVPHPQLHEGFAKAGFWLYPTSFPETSCITAMKAQAMGAIPITSRYLDSALPDTAGKYDLGPTARPGRIIDNPAWQDEWGDTVVEVVSRPAPELQKYREDMKQWARKTFLWETVAKQWHQVFNEALT